MISYALTVEASDGKHQTSLPVQIRVVAVNEFTPTFPGALPFVVDLPEDVDSRSLVTTYTAEDGDLGEDGQITYTIVGMNMNWILI